MTDRCDALRKGMKIIDVLLKGPYTVKEIAGITGLSGRTTYYYIKTISELLPVQAIRRKRKKRGQGRQPEAYWIEK